MQQPFDCIKFVPFVQHFVVGFQGFTPSDEIKTLIQEYHVGNVILMKRNVQSMCFLRCALIPSED